LIPWNAGTSRLEPRQIARSVNDLQTWCRIPGALAPAW